MVTFISRPAIFAALLRISGVIAGTPQVCSNPQLSCTANVAASCCFNSPGGQLLQTQFWDSSPSTGPSNSWTIHGLWPDHCDGTFDANCDPSREHSDIRSILQSFGKTDLLAYMDVYWKDSQGNDESFWSHEWDKHGTCVNTLEPACYDGYTTNQEVPDFFQKTVDLFKGLDSYTALSNAGIVPSTSATYTTAQIQAALQASFGFPVVINCQSGALNEIYYTFSVQGSFLTGTFEATSPDGTKSTCPASGIKYLPKTGSPAPTSDPSPTGITSPPSPTGTTSSPSPTGGSGSLSGEGFLYGNANGVQTGCLISSGKWFASGTCATYTATASGSGFTLTSRKGSCGISGSIFTCGSGVSATIFTATGDYLNAGGSSQFYASSIPSGSVQQSISVIPDSVDLNISWQSV